MPTIVIEDKIEDSPFAIVIEAQNRLEVLRLIENHEKFNQQSCDFLIFLDGLKRQGIITSYESHVILIPFDKIWS